MARTVIKNKVAIILGADNPVGRAAALQLAREGVRVVLAGFEESRLEELEQLILSKDGLPFVAPLSRAHQRNGDVLRVARENLGHFHFAVNALAFGDAPSDEPGRSLEEARQLSVLLQENLSGRGPVRYLSIWPIELNGVPGPDAPAWHAVLRVPETLLDAAEKGEGLRPAGVADAALQMLLCPPNACPAEVRLEYRQLTAGEKEG